MSINFINWRRFNFRTSKINVVVYGSPFLKNSYKKWAKPGDIICISSQVGKASKGLKDWNNNIDSSFIDSYLRPKAKIDLVKKFL